MSAARLGFRFSLWQLIAVLAFLALALAAVTQPRGLWWGLLHLAVIGSFIFAIPATIYRDGDGRAFWLGFAVFSWMIVLIGRFQLDGRPPLDKRIRRIISDQCTEFYREQATNAAKESIARGDTIFLGSDPESSLANQTEAELESIRNSLFHTLWNLFVLFGAWVGGLLSRWLYFSREPSRRPRGEP